MSQLLNETASFSITAIAAQAQSSVAQFYAEKVMPLLLNISTRYNKNKKVIAISTAICWVSLGLYAMDKVFKPPKNLRHLPYIGYFDLIKAFLTKDPKDNIERYFLSLVNRPNSNGVYVRPSPTGWEVRVSNPDALRTIFLKQGLFPKHRMLKDDASLGGKFIGGPNMAMVNGSVWKKQRTIANPAFNRQMPLKLFGQLTRQVFEEIDRSEGSRVDVSNLMERFTLDAIGKAGFGFDFDALRDKDSEWVTTYNLVINAMMDPLYVFFPFLERFSSRRKMIHQKLDNFLKKLDEIIINKRSQLREGKIQNENLDENEKDLLTLMIQCGNEDSENALSDKELKSNLCVFFLAGHDTTSNALAFAFYQLAVNPDVQQRAREEVIAVMGDEPADIVPNTEQLKQFSYLNLIIKENLRINGPAASIIPRIATEDVVVADGVFIPKGSHVNVDIYSVHHIDKIWKDADRFLPQRFEDSKAGTGMTYVPFGQGARQCVGMNFSLHEQRVFLSMLLRKYTWSLPGDSIHKDKVIISGFGNIGPHKLEIEFQRRY